MELRTSNLMTILLLYTRFLKMDKGGGLKQTDQETRKLMTMHKAFHTRDDIDRLYIRSKERGRGLTRIEDCVDALIQGLKNDIKKIKE